MNAGSFDGPVFSAFVFPPSDSDHSSAFRRRIRPVQNFSLFRSDDRRQAFQHGRANRHQGLNRRTPPRGEELFVEAIASGVVSAATAPPARNPALKIGAFGIRFVPVGQAEMGKKF